jgi:hypothetical protein
VKLSRAGNRPRDRALMDQAFGFQLAPQVRNTRLIDPDNRDIDQMANACRAGLVQQLSSAFAIDRARAAP